MSWKRDIGSTFRRFRDPIIGQEVLNVTRDALTRDFFLSTGFRKPIMCTNGAATLREKPEFYTPLEISRQLGPKSPVYVINVADQSTSQWTIQRWQQYFDTPSHQRKGTFNVISLEFSHTPLQRFVEPPEIVAKHLDWIQYWPKELIRPPIQPQSEQASPVLPTSPVAPGVAGKGKEILTYPKIQYYCLMGVKNCFTDFHIDFGGSSVWYHVVKGEKVFLMIPPTSSNLKAYERWTSSETQEKTFLAHLIPDTNECFRCVVRPGQTFFIPTGWIHAVYTPKDSMVFGGNFLHSLSIKLQTEVFEIEQRVNVPFKFRFPLYGMSYWYLLDHYVTLITQHRKLGTTAPISDWEQEGLVTLVDWLPQWKFLAPQDMKSDLWRPQFMLDVVEWWLKKDSKQAFPFPATELYVAANFADVMADSPIQKSVCFCGTVSEDSEGILVGCDFCGGWFHCHCIGMTDKESKNNKMFYCSDCIRRNLDPNSPDAEARRLVASNRPRPNQLPPPSHLTQPSHRSPSRYFLPGVASLLGTAPETPPPTHSRSPQTSPPALVTISAGFGSLKDFQAVVDKLPPFPPKMVQHQATKGSSQPPVGAGRPPVPGVPSRAELLSNPLKYLTPKQEEKRAPTRVEMLPPGSLGPTVTSPPKPLASIAYQPAKFSKAPGTPLNVEGIPEVLPRMAAVKRQQGPEPTENLQHSVYGDIKRVKTESMPSSYPAEVAMPTHYPYGAALPGAYMPYLPAIPNPQEQQMLQYYQMQQMYAQQAYLHQAMMQQRYQPHPQGLPQSFVGNLGQSAPKFSDTGGAK